MRGLHAKLATESGVTSHAVAAALGHTSFAVTSRHYVGAAVTRRSANRRTLRVLRGAGGAVTRDASEFTAVKNEAAAPEAGAAKSNYISYLLVRGRGLEPRWLLTASTSKENGPTSPKDFARLERQETSRTASERRIPVACDQNPGVAESDDSSDQIAAALATAVQVWRRNPDPRALRRALFELLRLLDG